MALNSMSGSSIKEKKLLEKASEAKIIAFDLNKTIADIEGPTQKEIVEELSTLSQTKKIVICSGYDLKGLKERFFDILPKSFNRANLFFISSNGSQLVAFDELGKEKELYINNFKDEELRNNFKEYFYEMINIFNNEAEKKGFEKIILYEAFDDKYENSNKDTNPNSFRIDWRDAQITFKGLVEKKFDKELVGDVKNNWDDEEKNKRKFLIQILEDILKEKGIYYKENDLGEKVPRFSFVAGGSTSIDINKTSLDGGNITKAEGLIYLSEKLDIPFDKIAYFGDDMGDGSDRNKNDVFARDLENKGLISIETDGKVLKTESGINIPDTISKIKNISGLVLKTEIEQLSNTETIFADLDETLIKSKMHMEEDMAKTIIEILRTGINFYIITGGKIETMNKNVVNILKENGAKKEELNNLKLMPVLGSELYEYDEEKNGYVLKGEKNEFSFSEYDHKEVIENFTLVFKKIEEEFIEKGINPWIVEINKIIENEAIGEQIENRGKTLALSIFGQDASSKTKDKLKEIENNNGGIDIRKILINKYKAIFEGTILTMVKGGSTTIDITKGKLDKSVGYNFVIENIDPSKTLFLGDLGFPGGNDYEGFKANEKAGGKNHLVNNFHETHFFLRLLLNNKKLVIKSKKEKISEIIV